MNTHTDIFKQALITKNINVMYVYRIVMDAGTHACEREIVWVCECVYACHVCV